MSKRDSALYITDIIEAGEKIFGYVKGMSYAQFKKDEKTFDAVVRNFEIIGEAAYNMPTEERGKYMDVPWVDISDMRNKLIHEYFGVDQSILWQTIQDDLPQILKSLTR